MTKEIIVKKLGLIEDKSARYHSPKFLIYIDSSKKVQTIVNEVGHIHPEIIECLNFIIDNPDLFFPIGNNADVTI